MVISGSEAQVAMVGGHGVLQIIDTNAHTGNFWLVQATESTVINAASEIDGTALSEAITLAAGISLVANFTSLKLTSGACVAVRSKPA